jgi:glycosyltransferase involved in cell wall biosynthesis
MRILFIASGIFPEGIAYSTRMINLSRLFHECGYDVHIISDYTSERFISSDEIRCYENCTFQSVTGKPSSLKRITNAKNSLKIVNRYLQANKVDVVLTNACSDRFYRLKKICQKFKIPLILDIVEWYDISSFKFGSKDPFYHMYNRCMKSEFKKADKFITISTLLEKYFSATGKEAIRIPTILDTEQLLTVIETYNKKIKIMYAGNSYDGKESFSDILEALKMLGDKRTDFELVVFGCSEEDFLKNLNEKSYLLYQLKDCVQVKGRIPQKQVHKEYMCADYSIFIRPERRSSHAGFPTKLAESFAAGTPVICNNTGDIGLYLKNKVNGFLLDDSSPETIKNTFEEIINSIQAEREQMRKQARWTAENSFDFRRYSGTIKVLFSSFIGNGDEAGR